MITIIAKHAPYDDGHLGSVMREMERRGAPTIRCLQFAGRWYALEGSHRLAAAHALGLAPRIIDVLPGLPAPGRQYPSGSLDGLTAWHLGALDGTAAYEFESCSFIGDEHDANRA